MQMWPDRPSSTQMYTATFSTHFIYIYSEHFAIIIRKFYYWVVIKSMHMRIDAQRSFFSSFAALINIYCTQPSFLFLPHIFFPFKKPDILASLCSFFYVMIINEDFVGRWKERVSLCNNKAVCLNDQMATIPPDIVASGNARTIRCAHSNRKRPSVQCASGMDFGRINHSPLSTLARKFAHSKHIQTQRHFYRT